MSLILKPRGRHLSEARRVPTPPPSPPDGSHPDWHAVASPTGMAPAACGPAIVGHGNTANPDAAVDQINALVPQTIVGGLLELAEFVQITTSWITTITFVSWPTTFRTTIRTMSSVLRLDFMLDLGALECDLRSNSCWKARVIMIGFLTLLLIYLATIGLAGPILRRRGWSKPRLEMLADRAVNMLLIAVTVAYAPLSSKLFELLACSTIGGVDYLEVRSGTNRRRIRRKRSSFVQITSHRRRSTCEYAAARKSGLRSAWSWQQSSSRFLPLASRRHSATSSSRICRLSERGFSKGRR
jgi:hypothetical protein